MVVLKKIGDAKMVIIKGKRNSRKYKSANKSAVNNTNVDKHKAWLIGGISVAILVVALLILFPMFKGGVYGKAITAPGGLELVQVDGTNLYSGDFSYESEDYKIEIVKDNGVITNLMVVPKTSSGTGTGTGGIPSGGIPSGGIPGTGSNPDIPDPFDENCFNDVDDDGDFRADCDDPDCWVGGGCEPDGAISCSKNDVCDTEICVPKHPQFPMLGSACASFCGDECYGDWECVPFDQGGPDLISICVPPYTKEHCSNGKNDDADTLIDCADSDCAEDPNCVDNSAAIFKPEEICGVVCTEFSQNEVGNSLDNPGLCEIDDEEEKTLTCTGTYGDNLCTYEEDETEIDEATIYYETYYCSFCIKDEVKCETFGDKEKMFGYPCETDANCDSNKCVWKNSQKNELGSVCTMSCGFSEDDSLCPSGWICKSDYTYSTVFDTNDINGYCMPIVGYY